MHRFWASVESGGCWVVESVAVSSTQLKKLSRPDKADAVTIWVTHIGTINTIKGSHHNRKLLLRGLVFSMGKISIVNVWLLHFHYSSLGQTSMETGNLMSCAPNSCPMTEQSRSCHVAVVYVRGGPGSVKVGGIKPLRQVKKTTS